MPPTTSVDSRIVTASACPARHRARTPRSARPARRRSPPRPTDPARAALAAHASLFSLGHLARQSRGSSAWGCAHRADLPGGGQCTQTLLGRSGHEQPREREHRAGDEHRAERDQHRRARASRRRSDRPPRAPAARSTGCSARASRDCVRRGATTATAIAYAVNDAGQRRQHTTISTTSAVAVTTWMPALRWPPSAAILAARQTARNGSIQPPRLADACCTRQRIRGGRRCGAPPTRDTRRCRATGPDHRARQRRIVAACRSGPRAPYLEHRRDHEEQTDRTGQSRQQRPQAPRSTTDALAQARGASTTVAIMKVRLCVAHHEHEGRRREVEDPHRAPGQIVIAPLAARELVHEHADRERADVRDDHHGRAHAHPGQPRHRRARSTGRAGRTGARPWRHCRSHAARCRGTTTRPTRAAPCEPGSAAVSRTALATRAASAPARAARCRATTRTAPAPREAGIGRQPNDLRL